MREYKQMVLYYCDELMDEILLGVYRNCFSLKVKRIVSMIYEKQIELNKDSAIQRYVFMGKNKWMEICRDPETSCRIKNMLINNNIIQSNNSYCIGKKPMGYIISPEWLKYEWKKEVIYTLINDNKERDNILS